MGRTNTKKMEARETRLKALPTSERLIKSALIKKKEGRILDASEKHALKMTSEHGEILRLWEQLRKTTEAEAADADGEDEEPKKKAAPEDTQAIKKSAYEHKYPIVEKLLRLLEPKFANHLRTPSISRVVQSMIKYGSASQVKRLVKLVSKDFAAYATDAYAHFAINALIRHVPHEVYDQLLTALVPAVPQLVTHKFGLEVIHSAYSSRWCSATDRNLLVLAIFKDNIAVMKQWKGYPVLEDVLGRNPPLRKRLLTRLFDLCDKLVSQKEAIGYPFVQRLTYAFVSNGTRDEVSELCDTLRPHIAAIALTREGAPLASLAFSLTEPKQRKEILRAFNDNLGPLATNKYSAPVIARLFDLLYDPQLMTKYLLKDLVEHLSQVVNSPYGYLIVLHLLTPSAERKERYFLHNWEQHNLYSLDNKSWNRHTWLTHNYETETVEICSKPAMASHLHALPTIVHAFLKLATATEDGAEGEQSPKKLVKHHASLIAREILHVCETQSMYKAAIKLTPADVSALERLAPAQGKREREDDDNDATAAPVTHSPQRANKKAKVEAKPEGMSKSNGESPGKSNSKGKGKSSSSASPAPAAKKTVIKAKKKSNK